MGEFFDKAKEAFANFKAPKDTKQTDSEELKREVRDSGVPFPDRGTQVMSTGTELEQSGNRGEGWKINERILDESQEANQRKIVHPNVASSKDGSRPPLKLTRTVRPEEPGLSAGTDVIFGSEPNSGPGE